MEYRHVSTVMIKMQCCTHTPILPDGRTNVLILIAGLLIWLGCATTYVASIVAMAAFSCTA